MNVLFHIETNIYYIIISSIERVQRLGRRPDKTGFGMKRTYY